MALGFYISFSGIVTFRSAAVLQDVARRMPLERMLVETDCPYLAPVPHRGKPNQPAWVRHTAEFIAELRGESCEAIAAATTTNFRTLFRPPAMPV
jgi:TatD DNase family protein